MVTCDSQAEMFLETNRRQLRTRLCMSRILTPSNGRWHDELKAVAYYGETDFEKWIHQHAQSLFPHHLVIPFKKEVVSKTTSLVKKPDLALLKEDLSEWVVVEVELEGHPLDHVLEQIRVFRDGEYNLPEMARYVREQIKKYHGKTVTLKRLKALFDASPPSILVIADRHGDGWEKEFRKLDVQFCIFEIYKNALGDHVYRIFGEYPIVFAEEAHCRPHPSLPNVIEVIGDFTFKGLAAGGTVDVICDEHLTQWSLLKEQGKQYLRFLGISNPLPLSRGDTYGLFRDKSDKYYFKRN